MFGTIDENSVSSATEVVEKTKALPNSEHHPNLHR
jgi:hypothetical protein